jgi:predicted GIY-YIG superfamily endonuclease
MGYVYLIEDIDSGTYKIGVTKSDPQRRLNKLQTGNSCKLSIKYL